MNPLHGKHQRLTKGVVALMLVILIKGMLFSSHTDAQALEFDHSELAVHPQQHEACSIGEELQTLLDLHNQSRIGGLFCQRDRKLAAPALEWSCELSNAAKKHAHDMHTNDFLSHEGSDGNAMGGRAIDAGYQWRSAGENAAQGFKSSEGG